MPIPVTTFSATGNGAWQAQTDPVFTMDSWGWDEASVEYSGRVTGLTKFLDGLRRFSPLANYANVGLVGSATQWHRSYPVVTVRYRGLRDGTAPPVKGDNSRTVQTAQVTATIAGTSQNATFTYEATRTTWTWAQLGRPPLASPHNSVINAAAPNIIAFSTHQDGRRTTVSTAAFTQFFNQLKPEQIVSDYRSTPVVDGSLWECSADVEYKFAN